MYIYIYIYYIYTYIYMYIYIYVYDMLYNVYHIKICLYICCSMKYENI